MQKKLLRTLAVIGAMLFLIASCTQAPASGDTTGSGTADIEILGAWSVTNITLDYGTSPGTNGCDFVISNGFYSVDYQPNIGSALGIIVTYNNTLDYFVVHVTNDTLYGAPYYEKIGWQLTTPSNMVLYAYDVETNQIEAESNTNVFWGPVSNCYRQ